MESGDGRIGELRECLLSAIQDIAQHPQWDRDRACVILSGGLDSSIAACAGAAALGLHAAFTVLCSPDATDRQHAASAASAAGLEHHVADISLDKVLEELPTCVRVLQSFDPMSLRNEIAVCRALREAAARGFACAVTGDGADELFGGYSFTHRLDDAAWEENRAKMARHMRFGSVPLGRHFGLFVTSPFTQPAVVEAATHFGKADCVQPRLVDATQQQQQPAEQQLAEQQRQQPDEPCEAPPPPPPLLGKLPLRHAFPELPGEQRWRGKDPIEVGCGTTELGDRTWLSPPQPGRFSGLVSDADFQAGKAAAAAEGVTLRDKEHLFYYQEFRRQFPGGDVPGKPRHGSDPCPACGWQLSHPEQTFCVTCGHYDAHLRGGGKQQAAATAFLAIPSPTSRLPRSTMHTPAASLCSMSSRSRVVTVHASQQGMPRRLRNARLAPALVAGVAAAQLGLVPAHVHALEMAAQQEPAMGTVASELAAPAASALQHLNLPSMLQDKLELALAFDSFPAALLSSLEVQPSELQQPAATQAGYKFRHMNQHGFCYSRVLCGPRGGAAGAAVDGA